MGFDIKDITDILPFILNNLSECAYIIVICIVFGFLVGKQFEKNRQKKKAIGSKSQLVQHKEVMGEKISDNNGGYGRLNNRAETIKKNSHNYQFVSFPLLDKMLNTKDGQVELTAVIELNYKKDKEEKV